MILSKENLVKDEEYITPTVLYVSGWVETFSETLILKILLNNLTFVFSDCS